MKTWIVCLDGAGALASIIQSDDLSESTGRASRRADGIAAIDAPSRLEALCQDEISGLVLCGQPRSVSALCQKLSDTLRSRILGIVPNDLARLPAHIIRERARAAVRGKLLQPRLAGLPRTA